MRVAVIGKNRKSGYSGGRIHGLMLAVGCARLGHTVDFYTDNMPSFLSDLTPLLREKKIRFVVTKLFLTPVSSCAYDRIFVIPHLATLKNFLFDRLFFYSFISRLRRSGSAKTIFLDFESPNWIASVSPSLRKMVCYINSNRIVKKCDLVLSSTSIGSRYAREYYGRINSNLKFRILSPPINSAVAEEAIGHKKTDSIIFFARFGQKHKGVENLVKVADAIPRGFELVVISNRQTIPVHILEELEMIADRNQVSVVFKSQICEKEKFALLASAKLLLFISKFEGFGLPPVEAQYVNTPVICSNLPVLREVNNRAVFDSFVDADNLRKKITRIINTPPKGIRDSIEGVARFENFLLCLKNLL